MSASSALLTWTTRRSSAPTRSSASPAAQIGAALGRLTRTSPSRASCWRPTLRPRGDLVEWRRRQRRCRRHRATSASPHPAWTAQPRLPPADAGVPRRAAVALELVDEVDLDAKSRERARFALTLLTEALAPTNTLLGNPTALAKAVETRGRSLLSGVRHLVRDIRRNGGMPSMVDPRPFKVGEQHRRDPRPGRAPQRRVRADPVRAEDAGGLRATARRHPAADQQVLHHRPRAGPSLVEHVVQSGVPYFAMSWRNPTPAQRDWNLDTYVAACKEAIEVACEITGATDANVVGICAGGITMACLLGHLAAPGERLVHSATFMVAGLDTAEESHDRHARSSEP